MRILKRLRQSNFHSKSQKAKGVALSSTKIDNSDSDEDNEFDPEKGNDESKSESKKGGENGKNHVRVVQCYECKGYEHVAQECPNKNKKKKVFIVTTWDDVSKSEDSQDEEGDSGGDNKNFITLAVYVHSNGSVLKSNCENYQKSSNFMDSNNEDSESDDEDAKYVPLKDAYDKLYEKSLRLNKVNGKLSSKFKNKESGCTKIPQ
ncbi:hypothetical protein Acr_00g0032020 [Actinidia rufa]|uniref:CCHC-type domain-containing protein n=1 Tax=Actinidia rufa TaxID=165716 RepID=A0A7J0DGH8_9ERIC|nr:hypothetical protein Acr_00g0032020 [Actinidia rufa]